MRLSLRAVHNQRGQIVVEYILIAAVMMGIIVGVNKFLKQNEIISGVVSKPWKTLAMMIENGVWEASDKKARALHPNGVRRISMKGGEQE